MNPFRYEQDGEGNMLLGDRLRLIRNHRKMALREVAEGICSIAYLSKIENNTVQPNESLLQMLALRLDVEEELVLYMPKEHAERVESIAHTFWTSGIISDNDALYLAILSNDVQELGDSVRIFGVLMRYYLDRREIQRAKEIYRISQNVLPEMSGDSFYPNAFHYYLACASLKNSDQQYPEAYQYYAHLEKCMPNYSEFEQAQLQYNISRVLQNMLEDKSLALVYSERAYRYFEKTNDDQRLIEVMIARGMQYWHIGEYEKALDSLFRAQEKLDQAGITNQKGIIQYNIGRVYQLQKRYEEAIREFTQCLELEPKNWEIRAHVHKRLSEIYYDCKQWDLIEDDLQEGLRLATEWDLQHDQIELRALQNRVYLGRLDAAKYEKEMKKLIQWCKDRKHYTYIKSLSNELGNHLLSIHSYKQSAMYFHLAHEADMEIQRGKEAIKV